jgi:hypothetical protein
MKRIQVRKRKRPLAQAPASRRGLVTLALLGAHLAACCPANPPATPAPRPVSPASAPPVVGRDALLDEARASFDEALARQTAGDWAGALVLLRRVAAVKATPHVRFNIALCEEFLGKLNAALGRYQQTAAEARSAGVPDVAREAEARAAALKQRIPVLRLDAQSAPPGTAFSLDGADLGAAALAGPIPVDPGSHVVVGTAAGHAPYRAVFVAEERRPRLLTPSLPRDVP